MLSLLLVASSVLFMSFDDDDDFEMLKNLDILHTLLGELNQFYVDEISYGKMIKTGIDAMLNSLDPYTNYFPESMMEDYQFMATGHYGGIGAEVQKIDNQMVISDCYAGSPAQIAGLKVGDLVLEVDGQSVVGKNAEDIRAFFNGNPKTQVELLIKRTGETAEREISITREKIEKTNVPYFGMLDKKTGYIKLSGFTQEASTQVLEALTELKEKHGAQNLILDLRGNPGGFLIESVKIVNIFIERGEVVVSTKGKKSQRNQTFRTNTTPYDKDMPLIVLINSSSASASEIVSGAIQDLDRGVLVGQRSFGKGLVQETRDLSYNTKMKLTIAKYYIPSGRCIQALDYSNRREDGSVGKVPDSLMTEFKTKHGRKVYDGGGVQPDLETEAHKFAKITKALLENHHIFNFATIYATKHDSIADPRQFKISDTEYAEFVNYVKDKTFDYESLSETQLKKLIETATNENYYNKMQNEFAALSAGLAHDRNKDLEFFKNEIKYLINKEIIGRYYYEKGQTEFMLLNDDPEVEKGLDLLDETEMKTYKSLLIGLYKPDK